MNKFKFTSGAITNYVLVGSDPQRVVVFVQNQHTDNGERLYTVIDETPDGIDVYTEKIDDLTKKLDIPKEVLLAGIKSAANIVKESGKDEEE